jgi:hypothetical protein
MIRELEFREEELRSYLLANPQDRHGDEFFAVVRSMQRRHVNVKSLAIEVGPEIMAKYTSTRAVDVVRLSAVRRSTWRKAE